MAIKLKSIINLMNRKRKKERKCKTRGKKGDLVFFENYLHQARNHVFLSPTLMFIYFFWTKRTLIRL